jgi:hypothetical protein
MPWNNGCGCKTSTIDRSWPGCGNGSGDAVVTAAAQACAHGDTKPYLSMVCRQLGLSVPRFTRHGASADGVGERHLAAMYEILRAPSARAYVR